MSSFDELIRKAGREKAVRDEELRAREQQHARYLAERAAEAARVREKAPLARREQKLVGAALARSSGALANAQTGYAPDDAKFYVEKAREPGLTLDVFHDREVGRGRNIMSIWEMEAVRISPELDSDWHSATFYLDAQGGLYCTSNGDYERSYGGKNVLFVDRPRPIALEAYYKYKGSVDDIRKALARLVVEFDLDL